MRRIKKFGIYQTSKVFGIIYLLGSAVFLLPLGLFMNMVGGDALADMPMGGGMFFMILPIIYGIIGFIFTAIGCAIYNLIAGWAGGIEVEVEMAEPEQVS